MTETAKDLLTEAEAAQLLRLEPDTLRHWRMRRKSGPPYIQPHRYGRVLYQRSDLVAWLEKSRTDPSPVAGE